MLLVDGLKSPAAIFIFIHIFDCCSIEKQLESNEAFIKRKTCTIVAIILTYSFWKHGITCSNPSALEYILSIFRGLENHRSQWLQPELTSNLKAISYFYQKRQVLDWQQQYAKK